MSEHKKHDHKKFDNKQPRPSVSNFNDSDSQDGTEENEKWNPTPEQFAAFQALDAKLCDHNLRMLLSVQRPVSLRELKDSTLHSAGTIEKMMNDWTKSGFVLETKGKYSLNPDFKAA
jgi:hypothetical protein